MRKSDIWKYHSYQAAKAIYNRERQLGRWTVSLPYKDDHMWCITVSIEELNAVREEIEETQGVKGRG